MSSQCTKIENIRNQTGTSSNSAHINETNIIHDNKYCKNLMN